VADTLSINKLQTNNTQDPQDYFQAICCVGLLA